MSSTPWSQEDAEKWAKEWTESTFKKNSAIHADDAFLAGLTKAAEMIEAAPSVYCSKPDECNLHLWSNFMTKGYDTHSAKLVGVRPIEGSEK